MPHYCCAFGCSNKSDEHPELSFHGLPLDDKDRLNEWVRKMRRDPDYFSITKYTKICSSHFKKKDFSDLTVRRKRLKASAVPSKFKWTKPDPVESSDEEEEMPVLKKLCTWLEEKDEETDSASEGEGDQLYPENPHLLSQKTQTSKEDYEPDAKGLPCHHAFSLKHLLSKCDTQKTEHELFTHFTGFNSYKLFKEFLNFILPTLDNYNLIYWGMQESQQRVINIEGLVNDTDLNLECTNNTNAEPPSKNRINKMTVANDLLLLLMKLCTGASNLDLAERFDIPKSTVSNKIITWINLMYAVLASPKIWPHRAIVIKNSPDDFCNKNPSTVIILDATELTIQVPTSLQKQSEGFSSYKHHTTLKCLIGVDPVGGIMFVSQLYEGSISDKDLVQRSGFFNVLEQKLKCGEILPGDSIMADRGFNIEAELKELGLRLNTPPFFREKGNFTVNDVIKIKTVAMHRIHVERAIGKVRRFRIFDSLIPVSLFGTVNQIWTVACLLSNFQNPIPAMEEEV